jgi:hypothetical protein
MISQLINIGNWFKVLFQTFTSLGKVIVLTRRPDPLPKPQAKICSLLGNGPSLKETLNEDLHFLKQTELVAVNNFATSGYYETLQPTNYVIHDPAFYLYDGVNFKRADIEGTFKVISENTTWPINIYVQQRAKKSVYLKNLPIQNPNIRLVHYNYTIFEGISAVKHWFFEKGWAMPQAQNVLVVALYLGIRRKFEEIYLFGADHSWHEQYRLNDDNVLELKHEHFYSKSDNKHIVVIDVNHNSTVTMSQQFASLAKAFRGYEILKEFAKYQKVRVLNASKKTYIDAFSRIRI